MMIIRKNKGIIKGRRGFTPVEIIFEIFVLSILIIPTALLLGHLSVNVSETETNSVATLLCIQKAEELMWNYDFATIENKITVSPVNFPAPYQNYSYQVSREYVDSEYLDTTVVSSDYKKIEVRVSCSGIPDAVVYILFVKLT